LIVTGDYTRAVVTAGDVCTGGSGPLSWHTLGTVRKIARAAKADGGIVMCNGTDTVAGAHDIFAWVACRGLLADTVLYSISFVADADCPSGTKCTAPAHATVNSRTWIRCGDALVAFSVVALVTDA